MNVFWHYLMYAVVIWYSTITIYVAIRGAFDIRHMLRELADRPPSDDAGHGFPVIQDDKP